jgi:GAF domain-containing protein
MAISASNGAFSDLALLNSYEKDYLTGQILSLDYLATTPLAPSEIGTLNTLNCQALINAPLLKRNQLVGLLAVHSLSPRTWNGLEIKRLAMLANLIAIAMG